MSGYCTGPPGEEGSVILNQVKGGEGHNGCNTATGEFTDMIAADILKARRTVISISRGTKVSNWFWPVSGYSPGVIFSDAT
jgi:hypothetical protein